MNSTTQNELAHYGVLGMKWGIRRGKSSQAYAKGVKKLKKMDAKVEKQRIKAAKLDAKSSKIYLKGKNDQKAAELNAESRKIAFKAAKLEKKGKKFYKKMEREFGNVSVKDLDPADVEYGKRYASRVLH